MTVVTAARRPGETSRPHSRGTLPALRLGMLLIILRTMGSIQKKAVAFKSTASLLWTASSRAPGPPTAALPARYHPTPDACVRCDAEALYWRTPNGLWTACHACGLVCGPLPPADD